MYKDTLKKINYLEDKYKTISKDILIDEMNRQIKS